MRSRHNCLKLNSTNKKQKLYYMRLLFRENANKHAWLEQIWTVGLSLFQTIERHKSESASLVYFIIVKNG